MARSIRSIRTIAALVIAGGLVASITAGGVAAGSGGAKVFDARLAGIPADMTGKVFMGVTGGGLPWRLDSGEAKLFRDGRIHVQVDGLVLAAGANEGTNPIPTGRAIVACGGDVAAMSADVPFSPTGDAEVDARISLPSSCLAPVVFFAGITGAGPRWFAVTGW